MTRIVRYPRRLVGRASDRRIYPEKWCPWCGAAIAPKIRTNGRLEDPAQYKARETCNADHSAKLRAWRQRLQAEAAEAVHTPPAEDYPHFEGDGHASPSVQPPSLQGSSRDSLRDRLGPKLYRLLADALQLHAPEILEVWGSDPKLQALDWPASEPSAFRPNFY